MNDPKFKSGDKVKVIDRYEGIHPSTIFVVIGEPSRTDTTYYYEIAEENEPNNRYGVFEFRLAKVVENYVEQEFNESDYIIILDPLKKENITKIYNIYIKCRNIDNGKTSYVLRDYNHNYFVCDNTDNFVKLEVDRCEIF